MTTFFQNEKKKKKRFYAIMLQIHFIECMKSLILQSNFKRRKRKHEKTHPFIRFRLAFSFHFER
ncbi:hypothetical protein EDC13_02880 [Helicobacter pylori]|nr:hypothetical protein EDC13_02880 [Helicobacter pylori]